MAATRFARLMRHNHWCSLQQHAGLLVTLLVAGATAMPPSAQLAAELTGVKKGWVANTWDGSPGGVTNSSQWVPIAMDGFFVKENDGSLYGATMWDEGGHESSTWSADGDMLGALVDTHGWARGGGQDIAADDSFVYSSQRQAPCGDGLRQSLQDAAAPPCTWPGGPTRYPINQTWYTIRRYKNQRGYPADNISESGGVGMGYDWSMTVIATTPWSTTHKASDTSILTGLAVGGGIVAVRALLNNSHDHSSTVHWSCILSFAAERNVASTRYRTTRRRLECFISSTPERWRQKQSIQ